MKELDIGIKTSIKETENEEVCRCCGNIYSVDHIKAGDDYNDFGYRHCPFCGMLIDEFAHMARM